VALSQEAMFAGTTCVFLLVPLVILARAYLRTRNPRLFWCSVAVGLFFLTDLILLLAHLDIMPGADQTELIEFVGDVGTAALLAIAFGMRLPEASP
jgi:hypothetical protein